MNHRLRGISLYGAFSHFALVQILAISVMLLTTGCVVGPNFKKPAAPEVTGYTPGPVSTTGSTPNVTGGEGNGLLPG